MLCIYINTCRAAQSAILQGYSGGSASFEAAINQYITWTPEAAAGLEESIRSGPLTPICRTDQPVSM